VALGYNDVGAFASFLACHHCCPEPDKQTVAALKPWSQVGWVWKVPAEHADVSGVAPVVQTKLGKRDPLTHEK
jgi:hypothetical protein